MARDDHGNDNNREYRGWGDAGPGYSGGSSSSGSGGSGPSFDPSTSTQNGDTAAGGYTVGDYTGNKREAEYLYRDMYKAQWSDYQRRFLPYQDKLTDAVTSRDMLDQQLSRIRVTNRGSNTLSRKMANITRARYGMAQSAQQANSFNSNLNLQSAMGIANAENNARSSAYDRYQAAMTGASLRPEVVAGNTGGATS